MLFNQGYCNQDKATKIIMIPVHFATQSNRNTVARNYHNTLFNQQHYPTGTWSQGVLRNIQTRTCQQKVIMARRYLLWDTTTKTGQVKKKLRHNNQDMLTKSYNYTLLTLGRYYQNTSMTVRYV